MSVLRRLSIGAPSVHGAGRCGGPSGPRAAPVEGAGPLPHSRGIQPDPPLLGGETPADHETRNTRSVEGRTSHFLVRITDPSVSDDDKQILLVTGMHSGAERSGAAAVLHFMEWVLSDSPDAAETRRKQIVLLMPIVNPWGFFTTESNANSQGIDPYSGQRGKAWDIEKLTVREPDKAPEIMAYKSVVDGIQARCPRGPAWRLALVERAAYHRVCRRRLLQFLPPSVGLAHHRGHDRRGAQGRRRHLIAARPTRNGCSWGPDMTPLADRLWLGRPFFYTATYGYVTTTHCRSPQR